MRKPLLTEDYCCCADRVWLLMAVISSALSEHPIIRGDAEARHLTDQARKALFDLHARLLHRDRLESPALHAEQGENMLRVTIELVPGGRESGARIIGRGHIANVSNLSAPSDYVAKFEEREWEGVTRGPYTSTLTQWPRHERGAWEIVQAALAAALAR